jgi:hypothetical protein
MIGIPQGVVRLVVIVVIAGAAMIRGIRPKKHPVP